MNKTLKKLYNLLNFRQKLNFFFVLIIMIASAVLAQITPKAIGWLTDDILIQEQISFDKIVPIQCHKPAHYHITQNYSGRYCNPNREESSWHCHFIIAKGKPELFQVQYDG